MTCDWFHVQRLVQDALYETRRDEVREVSSAEEKKGLKNTRWPLLKNAWNLTNVESKTLEELGEASKSIY